MHLREKFGVSERRATRVLKLHRSTARYPTRPDRSQGLRESLRRLASECPRYGYRMMADRLRYEGLRVNYKRVHRVYREEGLQLARRRRKRLRSVPRQPLPEVQVINSRWSADFVHDMFGDGRRFRVLNVVDNCSRECLASDASGTFPGSLVARVLDGIAVKRGYPDVLVIDNGPEFRGREMDAWACRHGVRLHFIDPGKPVQNAFVESFNDKFRSECLNTHWFTDLEDARTTIERWRREYNERRPHSSLGGIPPAAFARRAAALRAPTAPSGLRPEPPLLDPPGEAVVTLTLDQ